MDTLYSVERNSVSPGALSGWPDQFDPANLFAFW